MDNSQYYHFIPAIQAANFVDQLIVNSGGKDSGRAFDSAGASDFIDMTSNQGGLSVQVPGLLQEVFDEYDKPGQALIAKAFFDGVNTYERQHGCKPPADIIYQAVHSAYATSEAARNKFQHVTFDSASTSLSSQSQGLQPNRAVIAILSVLNEAIPFAHYLPADIGSNEARLIIISHSAGKTYGEYAAGGSMDGVLQGKSYITASRFHTLTNTAGALSGKLTAIQDTTETCDQGVAGVKLVRGRCILYINGYVVAKETSGSGTGTSVMSGEITIGATKYVIGGTVDPDTGVAALTTTPALPGGNIAVLEGVVDYERDSTLIPDIVIAADPYKLHAASWQTYAQQSIASRTQMINELGLDPYSQAIMTIQSQYSNERHYTVLTKGKRLAANNPASFDFAWATQGLQKTRAQIFQDFSALLSQESQAMAERTLGFGITHCYVGKAMKAQLEALPRDLFEPSGIIDQPGIYRIGRAFGREWYYNPRTVEAGGGASSKIQCFGRANDVARNPFVLGDAVPPTVVPLAVNSDLKSGSGFYARNFTEVNPYMPSAMACSEIDVTNLK